MVVFELVHVVVGDSIWMFGKGLLDGRRTSLAGLQRGRSYSSIFEGVLNGDRWHIEVLLGVKLKVKILI